MQSEAGVQEFKAIMRAVDALFRALRPTPAPRAEEKRLEALARAEQLKRVEALQQEANDALEARESCRKELAELEALPQKTEEDKREILGLRREFNELTQRISALYQRAATMEASILKR